MHTGTRAPQIRRELSPIARLQIDLQTAAQAAGLPDEVTLEWHRIVCWQMFRFHPVRNKWWVIDARSRKEWAPGTSLSGMVGTEALVPLVIAYALAHRDKTTA